MYEPDVNLAHGLEEEETLGYVDINNITPWDTWIAYIVEPEAEGLQWVQYLLSWVPPEFIPLVGGGIDVCPDECIRWLDCEECALSHILRDRGIF